MVAEKLISDFLLYTMLTGSFFNDLNNFTFAMIFQLTRDRKYQKELKALMTFKTREKNKNLQGLNGFKYKV